MNRTSKEILEIQQDNSTNWKESSAYEKSSLFNYWQDQLMKAIKSELDREKSFLMPRGL